ncbi:MAG: IS200/IS605 family transposase [Methanobrevibacter sp.]|jgi:putative transposase|nr:IS200/IS605 family transposase [Candidatus Methanovirga basalitermitum]
MNDYNKTTHSILSLNYHLVLVTKYRKKVITDEISARLKKIFIELSEVWNIELNEYNKEEDHIHILFSSTADINLQKFVQNYKLVSSRKVKKEYPKIKEKIYKGGFWKIGYFLASTGGVTMDIINQYVQRQGIHG